ncbi:hypothetical protein [Nocardia terpenica]|uniref:Uncharacterized protein n=1 Tax=Nocardia terpenica TaxID=455432 RepID=A0A164JHV8_9NOCA|nr:hypothetical protein [Nocardia terpenica]KZM70419.1 hypothetical protein AWN90_03830 [Nocardia terpenica]NQE91101.1 hypothetical protein [Nocardia terpenica]
MTRPARALIVVIGVLAVAACTSGEHPSAHTAHDGACAGPGFTAPFEQVDPCAAAGVMTAAVTAIFSYRPAQQSDPRAAFRSAEALMEPGFAAGGEPAAVVLAPVPAVVWRHWQTTGTSVAASVQVTGDDHPTDTATAAARVLAVQLRPSDGEAAIGFAAYTRASRANPGAGWLVSGIEVRQ